MKPLPRTASCRGFTLVEMLVVLFIIGALMLASLPSGGHKIDQAGISESVNLIRIYQPQVELYYLSNGEFPEDNEAVGMPEPQSIAGNFLRAVHQQDGALHLEMGNKIRPELQGKFLSLRPIFVPGVENTPISWICGNDEVPPNMLAAGENRTDIESFRLPLSCR